MDDPCYHIGGGVPQIDIKIKKSYVWYLKKPYTSYKWYIQVVSFQQTKRCPSKIQDSSLNHLPQMHTLASMRNSPFMEIDDKGGEIIQRYEKPL